jgi:hypothetical protein
LASAVTSWPLPLPPGRFLGVLVLPLGSYVLLCLSLVASALLLDTAPVVHGLLVLLRAFVVHVATPMLLC